MGWPLSGGGLRERRRRTQGRHPAAAAQPSTAQRASRAAARYKPGVPPGWCRGALPSPPGVLGPGADPPSTADPPTGLAALRTRNAPPRRSGWGTSGCSAHGQSRRCRCPDLCHQVLGVFWGAWKARERDANRANIEAMLGLISRGELRPPRGRVYRLHEWRTAFDDLMQHRAVGKVCIDLGTAEARL